MANQGPQSYCNTFKIILGTSGIWSKSGPVALLMITNMLQNIQENMETSWKKHYLCEYGTRFFLRTMYVLGTMLFENRISFLKVLFYF